MHTTTEPVVGELIRGRWDVQCALMETTNLS